MNKTSLQHYSLAFEVLSDKVLQKGKVMIKVPNGDAAFGLAAAYGFWRETVPKSQFATDIAQIEVRPVSNADKEIFVLFMDRDTANKPDDSLLEYIRQGMEEVKDDSQAT